MLLYTSREIILFKIIDISDLWDFLFVEFYRDFEILTLYVMPFGNCYDHGNPLGLFIGYFNSFRKNRKIKNILTLQDSIFGA